MTIVDMNLIDQLSHFTQKSYLECASVKSDSQVTNSSDFSYVKSTSGQERWYNTVICRNDNESSRNDLVHLISSLTTKGINCNLHVWVAQAYQLPEFLTMKLGLQPVGYCDFLAKRLVQGGLNVQSFSNVHLLSEKYLHSYVKAKVLSWGNSAEASPSVEEASRYLLNHPHHYTYVYVEDEKVIAAASFFRNSQFAYFRGSFVVPEYRGRGIYRALMEYRELDLLEKGIKYATTLADQNTSSRTLQNLGYDKLESVAILACKRSTWISL